MQFLRHHPCPGAAGRLTASVALAASAMLLVTKGCACSGSTPRFPGAPLVVVSIDTLRSDHLPAYGYRGVATPNLDRFRKDAILFEHAYAQVPLTLPSHVTLFTGLLPFQHGVRDNLGYQLDPAAHPTLARVLKQHGYATGAAVSAWVLRGASGIGDGFDSYDDRIAAPAGADAAGRVQRKGDETTARAEGWLHGVKDRPFFLFLHLYEPHAPYDPPEPFRSRYPLAYDGEIAASDAFVGRLLDELRRLGLYDRAVIVVLSDHGEGLGEHGEDEHGILLYRWALQVPLLLKLPGGRRAGERVATPASLVDVVPTLLSLLGVKPKEGLPGRSLLEPATPSPRRIYAETYYPRIHLGWSDLRSLVDERDQYIEGARRELYDLARDPGERDDLAASEGDRLRARQKELAAFPSGLETPGAARSEELQRLAALGYLGGAVATGNGPLPDPRTSLPVLAEVKGGFRLAAAGRDEEAIVVFGRVLERYPSLLDARYEMGQALARLGRDPEAYQALREAVRTSPSLAPAISPDLARVCLRLGRLGEAEANARLAAAASPSEGHVLMAQVALARNDTAAAEREARAVTADPGAELRAAVVLADVAIRRERFADAVAVTEAASRQVHEQHLPPVPDLEFLRGDALARLGRYPEAQAAFESEIRSFPGNSKAYSRLAIVYGLEHRTVRDVDALLERMVAARPGRDTLELAASTLESMGGAVGAKAWRRRAVAGR
ncbi:MAG TPA: sulfatase-like hydrolase/transferase [Vicinamibacteria bacterium]|nr:sulfatase-like hydrolase/transferase [Vicinamibacteria bacterium]